MWSWAYLVRVYVVWMNTGRSTERQNNLVSNAKRVWRPAVDLAVSGALSFRFCARRTRSDRPESNIQLYYVKTLHPFLPASMLFNLLQANLNIKCELKCFTLRMDNTNDSWDSINYLSLFRRVYSWNITIQIVLYTRIEGYIHLVE